MFAFSIEGMDGKTVRIIGSTGFDVSEGPAPNTITVMVKSKSYEKPVKEEQESETIDGLEEFSDYINKMKGEACDKAEEPKLEEVEKPEIIEVKEDLGFGNASARIRFVASKILRCRSNRVSVCYNSPAVSTEFVKKWITNRRHKCAGVVLVDKTFEEVTACPDQVTLLVVKDSDLFPPGCRQKSATLVYEDDQISNKKESVKFKKVLVTKRTRPKELFGMPVEAVDNSIV